MRSLPDKESEAAEWLQQLFREKDALQDSFIKHGDFFTGTDFKRVEPIVQKPRLATLVNTIAWAFITLTPMLYYLMMLLFSGELLYFSIGVGIITICEYDKKKKKTINKIMFFIAVYVLMQKTIGMSKISKGSSYGSDQKSS